MEGVYAELDEAKSEIGKLREELKLKSELSENLKKRHNEQVRNASEASLKIENQTRELIEKEEEISTLKEKFRELQESLNEKESNAKQLRAANEKLKIGGDEKLRKQREENEALSLALEEANRRNFDREQEIREREEEIEGLKASLSFLREKCSGAEKKMNENGTKEAREIDEAVLGLEEGKRKIEDQLKWKKEQFSHLEEAHRKMKADFKAREREWDSEKSSLLDEISSLQTRLDSEIGVSEDLRNRIASLRQSLGRKEAALKEAEYQKRTIEQENEELRVSVKEFQESQIVRKPSVSSGSPSVAKLRSKLKCSEQILKAREAELNSELESRDEIIAGLRMELKQMRETSENLGSKEEAERKSRMVRLGAELSKCKAELESRDVVIEELRMALENFEARESEWKSRLEYSSKEAERRRVQLEKMTNDLNNYRLLLESRDKTVRELGNELERVRDSEAEWKSGAGKMTNNLENRSSQLQRKEEEMKELKSELERQHEDYGAALEDKDAKIKAFEAELEQVRRDFIENLKAKEADWKSRVEKIMKDFEIRSSQLQRKEEEINELKSEFERQREDYGTALEGKDAKINSFEAEYEQARGDLIENLKAKEAEWKSRVEKIMKDFEIRSSQLQRKEEEIDELKSEFERQREDYGAALEGKDVKIKVLEVELEQVRIESIKNLKAKEAEWSCQLETKTVDLNASTKKLVMDLETKDAEIKTLGSELEWVREDFSENLKSKETEWTHRLRRMASDRDAKVKELETDLENCRSIALQLKLQTEEISMTLLVLQNGISDAQLKISSERADLEKRNKIESTNVDRCEEMLMESSICEVFLREQVLEVERETRKRLNEVFNELERANRHGYEAEFELYMWKSTAERFEAGLKESLAIRRELEGSLLAQVVFEETLKLENQNLVRTIEERNERIAGLGEAIASLESQISKFLQESMGREIVAKIGEERRVEELKESETRWFETNVLELIGGLDDRIGEISSEDQKLTDTLQSILLSCPRKDSSVDAKENTNSPATTKKFEASSDVRLPFTEINHLV